jgi:arylsulfatase A-like enzyme/Tfp pilus assembly protein PilF
MTPHLLAPRPVGHNGSLSMREGRHHLLCMLAACLVLWTPSLYPSPRKNTGPANPAPTRPPSVVLITLDTVRADHLACYGYRRIETPTIDGLAREGVRFNYAYAQVPLTLPSHTVILTGTYPIFNGVRDLTSPGLVAAVPTLAEILGRYGYQTAAFVSSFVLNSMWGLRRGFEVYDDATDVTAGSSHNPSLLERRGDHTVDRALAWLDSHSGQTFFLWVHLYDPHSPYHPPEPYFSRYASHLYDGEIAFDDVQLGRLFAGLRRLGLYDRALILAAGDHGESLGEHGEAEHGFLIYNATLRVPLIVKLPGSVPRPGVINDPVGLVDVAPAIAEVCGVPLESTQSFQGHSLLRLLEHQSQNPSPAVYAESYYSRSSFGWHELRALITPQFKYIDAPRAELYALKEDPEEMHNLAPSRSSLAAALRETLDSLAGRFVNARTAESSPRLDSETLEKLRSLGYIGYEASSARGDSRLARTDPKDKIGVVNQLLRASNLTSVNRFSEAEDVFKGLERAEPDLYIVAFERGENLLNWGNAEAAIGELHKALALNPGFDQAWVALGRAAFVLAHNKEATDALQLALRLNARNYLARRMLARVYWRENQPTAAESELAQVVREEPNFGEARAEHGIALVKLRQYRRAIPELRAAPDLGYRDAIVYYYSGIAYGEAGDDAQAIEAYEKAIELDPQYAAAYINLALQYRKRHEMLKAHQNYRKGCQFSEELCRKYSSQF